MRAAQRIGNALPGDIQPPDDTAIRLEPGGRSVASSLAKQRYHHRRGQLR
jgi:hypothetical protein